MKMTTHLFEYRGQGCVALYLHPQYVFTTMPFTLNVWCRVEPLGSVSRQGQGVFFSSLGTTQHHIQGVSRPLKDKGGTSVKLTTQSMFRKCGTSLTSNCHIHLHVAEYRHRVNFIPFPSTVT